MKPDANELPGYINGIKRPNDVPRAATWAIMLFPSLDQNAAWARWSDPTVADLDLPTPYMEILVCPSDPPETPDAHRCRMWPIAVSPIRRSSDPLHR